MLKSDLPWMSAANLIEAFRAKTLSPVEVTKAVIEHIEQHNERVNAFAHFAPEEALKSARVAEQAYVDGNAGPLAGVPTTIKDMVRTATMPTRNGSRIALNAPFENAPVAQRLIDAGAVILGKTTVSEFGWTGVSRSPLTGLTHNPWKFGTNAGASSAGAGAAAASGFGTLHQGSDGAGSIRMPAHFCGVFGLKPTYGRVPYYPLSLGDLTSHIGPLTRFVRDAALMLDVMSGHDPRDFTSLPREQVSYADAAKYRPKGRRIAFSRTLGHARVDPEVAALSHQAANLLAQALDCDLECVEPAWGARGTELGRFFWSAHEAHLAGYLDAWSELMDPGLVACIEAGRHYSMQEYQTMRAKKYEYVSDIHRWFEPFDLLLTPAASVVAFPLPALEPTDWPKQTWDWMQWAEFSYPFNMSGNPAASVPCGSTTSGLPVGLQIVGRRFDDIGVLQASSLLEELSPWHDRRPF